MQLTILRPGARTSQNYQVGYDDYVSVSHLDLVGEYPLPELMRITVGPKTDARNVDVMLEGMEMKERKRNERR